MRCPSLSKRVSSPAPMNSATARANTIIWIGRGNESRSEIRRLLISIPRSCVNRLPKGDGHRYANGCGIWDQGQNGSEHHHDKSRPNPRYKRVEMRFDNWPSGGFVNTFVDQIKIRDQH